MPTPADGAAVYDLRGHRYQWRDGRPVHLAVCPCWAEDVPTAAVLRGRWTSVGSSRPSERPGWRKWLGL